MGFKQNFVWGAATSSYQIEGAAFEDGKGLNIWDTFTREQDKVFGGHTGDIACDHYHRMKEDVKLMASLGLKAYRFSIDWARVFPEGTGQINEKGLDFYDRLIEELIHYDITPFITLYHWELPYALHCKGGWLNDDISKYFGEYVQIIAKRFSDRVTNFITLNEPQVFVGCGYKDGSHAPGYQLGTTELLHIGHNVLKSHGMAVSALRAASSNRVSIGISGASGPACPISLNKADIDAARNAYFETSKDNFVFSDSYWFDPVFLGKYPQWVYQYHEIGMPDISDDDMRLIGQPIDFVGTNIYRGRYVKASVDQLSENLPLPVGFPRTSNKWEITPEALRWGPYFLNERYQKPVFITENGMAAHDAVSLDGKVHDYNRQDYMQRYLMELKKAVESGADIGGYFAWSLMDNFEWSEGYNERFGLIHVDYTTQKRTIKDSALWYKTVIESNGDII